ncbi:restriction endonuclease subunit S [Mammaliicoccus sciuri]|uniref:restriction endonuclease subunit S n=1 Tax=Mammaliicoccus sciuri TaxID=1296 RepID=UPI000CD24337|nr:restriction endonuclease subunit S [Mammaliicoccus sciuri]PNZ30204.1 restriction endonuclease subunit S [Mammaliicoccus sciuri]PTJ49826.1 restriction endonuclease subunit S [Mammaliicoccus sciuri]
MTNEVKKVPELRFPEFDGEWEGIYLNKLGMFKKNYTFSRANEGDGTLRHIHYGDIHSKFKSKIEKIELLPSISIDLEDPQLVQNNDLIFADASEDYNDLGKTILMKVNNGNVIAGLHTHLFSPNNNLNSEFLLYFTQTKVYRKFIKRQGVGISVLGISKKNLDKLLVSLPKYNEQKKIGEFFSKLDQQIELEEQKLEKLEEQKKGYMQKIFSQELRFKDGSGNEYPEWEDVKLQNIANIKKGEQIKKENIDNNGKYYHLNGGTTASSRTNLFNTNPFTISISEGGNSCGFIKMNKEYFFSGGHNYTLLDLSVSNFYLYAYLKYHEKKIMSLRVGSGLPNIQKKDISNYLIKIPRKEEQEKIGSFFKNLDEFIEKQANKVELLKQRKQSFLQKMFV